MSRCCSRRHPSRAAAIQAPTLVLHATGISSCPSRPDAMSPTTSRGRASWNWQERTLLVRTRSISTRRKARSSSSGALAGRPDPVLVTLLFTDIVGSTEHAGQLGDRRCGNFSTDTMPRSGASSIAFRARRSGAGDGFVATFDGPARAIRCACAIRDAVRELGLEARPGRTWAR